MIDQYSNFIRAVTMLMALFIGTWIYRSCQAKQSPPQIQNTQNIPFYDHSIRTLDSLSFVIPYDLTDSLRAEYLKNYTKRRTDLHR